MQEEKKKEIQQFQPGFRFYPTEEELVSFYLRRKLEERREPDLDRVIPAINICEFEPWLLPKLSGELCNGDTEQWFFFVPRQEREARGGRPNRTTPSGYWKATGSPSYVYSSNNRVIGVKKSMVFYRGKAPTGKKTTWKMNEYRAIEEEMPSSSTPPIPKLRHEVSLCRVYIISGSFRAFDRRPLGTSETRVERSQDLAARSRKSSLLPSQISESVETRKSSLESSSSAKDQISFDHMDICTEGSSNFWKMADGSKNLWDELRA